MNWFQIGKQLQEMAMEAHGGCVDFPVALDFMLDSPDLFGVADWPAEVPVEQVELGYDA